MVKSICVFAKICSCYYYLCLYSILLFAFAFLLFYSKVGISYCWTRSSGNSYLALLDMYICMSSVFKFKPTVKNVHTINCIIYSEIFVYCLASYRYSLSGIPNRLALDFICCSWNFLQVSQIMLKISPIMLALCFMLSSPYYVNIINPSLDNDEKWRTFHKGTLYMWLEPQKRAYLHTKLA